MSVNVTLLINEATKGAETAFIGQLVIEPVSEANLVTVLEGFGDECARLFPDKFAYAQPVRVEQHAGGPDAMGVMIVFAPFPAAEQARAYMHTVSEAIRAGFEITATQTHEGPDTRQ